MQNRKALYLAACLLLVVGTVGCATIPKSTPPPGCEDSLIYQHIPYPEAIDLAVKLAVFEIAKHEPEYRATIYMAIGAMEELLTHERLTYAHFFWDVTKRVEWLRENVGAELIIVSETLRMFDGVEIPVSDCDRTLLLKHLAQQRMYLGMLGD